jgi:hypothetical protein
MIAEGAALRMACNIIGDSSIANEIHKGNDINISSAKGATPYQPSAKRWEF